MGRVAKTAQQRGEDELSESALEIAEQAAREALVRAALRGGKPDRDGEHPWDAARNAARSSPGGGAWAVVLDGSRSAIGEEVWEEAMAEARSVVDELLVDAPDIVARAVAAAVAREASLGRGAGRRLPRRRGGAGPRRRRRRRRAGGEGVVAVDGHPPQGRRLRPPGPPHRRHLARPQGNAAALRGAVAVRLDHRRRLGRLALPRPEAPQVHPGDDRRGRRPRRGAAREPEHRGELAEVVAGAGLPQHLLAAADERAHQVDGAGLDHVHEPPGVAHGEEHLAGGQLDPFARGGVVLGSRGA